MLHIALMSTKVGYRPSHIRRELTAANYNASDRQGLQIVGEDGLKIYTRSKRDTKNEEGNHYNALIACVKKACEERGVSFRDCMKDFRSRKRTKEPIPVPPDADDQLAINAAMAAFAAEDAVRASPAEASASLAAASAPEDTP